MGLRTNIILLVLVAVLSICRPLKSYAADNLLLPAQSGVTDQSPEEFAASKQLQNILAALRSDPSGVNIIQCGTGWCNLDTHKCYKETTTNQQGGVGGSSITVNYKCSTEKPEDFDKWWSSYKVHNQECTSNCFDPGFSLGPLDIIAQDFANDTSPVDNKVYTLLQGERASIAYAEVETQKSYELCEVLPVKLYNYKKCFFCKLVGVVYSGSTEMVDVAFFKTADAFATILILGFVIWIAIQILATISSLTKQDIPKFINNLLKQSYKVLIAFFLLTHSQQIFSYGIRPLIGAALNFGQGLLASRDIFAGLPANENGEYQIQAGVSIGGVHLGKSTYIEIEKFIVAVQQEISVMQAVGTELWCIGGNILSNLNIFHPKEWEPGEGLKMMLYGGIITVFGFLMSLAFVFYLLDAIVQIGIVGILAPFLIACWPFKQTAKWTKTGMDMFLNSLFVFIFMGFIISIDIELISGIMGSDGGADLFEVAQLINNTTDPKILTEHTTLTGVKFLLLLFGCIFGFKFIGQGTSLAGKFAGGISPIAPKIATMGASFAKNMALKSTQSVREAAEHKIDKGVSALLALPTSAGAAAIKFGRNVIKKIRNRKNPPEGTDTTFKPSQQRKETDNSADSGSKNPTSGKKPVVGQQSNQQSGNSTSADTDQPTNPTPQNAGTNPSSQNNASNPETTETTIEEKVNKAQTEGVRNKKPVIKEGGSAELRRESHKQQRGQSDD